LKARLKTKSKIVVKPKIGHDSLNIVGDYVGVGLTLVLSFFKPFHFGFDIFFPNSRILRLSSNHSSMIKIVFIRSFITN
jgi:hypothetical protein